ncbi:histidine phosphatase family protein [Candidatus Bathyarchaeota archaeon]|nr:histidine phosphatase family protein [Candidatus Bathyarchaeota archaeon]
MSIAELTAEGVSQVQHLGQLFAGVVSSADSVPPPGTVYTSPLARCLETTRLVYSAASGRW